MLILNEAAHPKAPGVACDEPGCDWFAPLAKGWGDREHRIAEAALTSHMIHDHAPETAEGELEWEVRVMWQAATDGSRQEPPDPDGGSPWEPFASFLEERAGVPGIAVAWRRGGPPQDVELRITSDE